MADKSLPSVQSRVKIVQIEKRKEEMTMNVFRAAEILLPKTDEMEKWAVIACDQFTSDRAYWDRVRKTAGNAPSAINLILPEAELGTEMEAAHTALINETMKKYTQSDVFTVCENSYIYVERTLENGSIRKGLVGMVDLDAYDFSVGSTSAIRATEKTVVERIPPRMRVRRDASVELPHILMLCDDHERVLIEPLTAQKETLQKVYDFDLMEGGGHISGWLVQGAAAEAFDARLSAYAETVGEKYADIPGVPMLFAVGDGNHSLATAKSLYEELKAAGAGSEALARARYAMVELENIRDEAQVFEPIHRLMYNVDVDGLMNYLKASCGAEDGYPIVWMRGDEQGTLYLDKNKGILPVAILQAALDKYLSEKPGNIDYIHGEDALRQLSKKPGSLGLVLEAVAKNDFFRGIASDGVLPRKTFSMGEAQEKRYYLEARKL